MSIIIGAIIFGITRALDGRDLIPRWAMPIGIFLGWYVAHPASWLSVIMGAITAGLLSFGWNLCAIDPNGVRDWYKKFPPTKLFQIDRIKNNRMYGMAGMAIRWAIFTPLVALSHGLVGLPLGIALGVSVGLIYGLGGLLYCKGAKWHLPAMVLIEFTSATLMGLAVL